MPNVLTVYLTNNEKEVIDRTSITKVSEEMLATRDDVVRVEISEGVEMIEEYAFEKCINLEEVICPKSLKKIAHGAFADCVKLVKVEYGPDVEVDEGAFSGCLSYRGN